MFPLGFANGYKLVRCFADHFLNFPLTEYDEHLYFLCFVLNILFNGLLELQQYFFKFKDIR
jgi:hypothetical protein